ncbi:MAG TPA: hypothetical protein VHZ33_10935 [Trebonia sp.]|nr:hypothetical protein [Trebonia sp.]
MRTARSPRDRRPAAQRTLLAPAVLATALLATAAVGVMAGRPVAGLSAAKPTANQAAVEARAVVSSQASPTTKKKTAKTPGWRVVAAIGPYNQAVTGRVAAGSAADAWSVWTGTSFTAVERLVGTRWSRVPLPARLNPYVRSAVAFGGYSPAGFWLFSSRSPTRALRFSGGKWTLQTIPSWVLRRGGPSAGGDLSAVSAVFGPGDVWLFSLNAGAYAAHYNGRGWTRVRLPAAPDEVSAVSPDDIWALHGNVAWHWNGRTWTATIVPKAAGSPPESFADLTATGPRSVSVWRTILAPGPATEVSVLSWNGASWRRVAASAPADLVDSVAPDGSGGLWATGVDINPGGFNLFYHLTAGRWTEVSPPKGIWDQQPEYLTWIPGTRSLWGTATGLTNKGNYGVIIKYGP